MSLSLLRPVADFSKQLASSVAISDTTAELNNGLDADGVQLTNQKIYGFTVDSGSKKEYIIAYLDNDNELSQIVSISRQGVATSGFAIAHNVGTSVQITDWAVLSRITKMLNGETDWDAGVPLKYDGTPAQTNPLALATVQFVLDTASGSTVLAFNPQTLDGVVGENVSDGDWVYFKEADGKWWKTDADSAASSVGVKIGKVRATTTADQAVAGGIFVSGTETEGTYVAGTTYYLSNTAGALSTSAGTNSVKVGVGDENGDLVVTNNNPNEITPNERAALAGSTGTPSSTNKFVTQSFGATIGKLTTLNAGAAITGATLPVPVYQNKTDNEVYACDGNDLAALKFLGFATSDGTDGNPIDVQMAGVVSGFSSLDEGEKYYLSDTVGTIQNSPGTYEVLVGVAISSTQLLIQKGQRRASGVTSFTTTTTETITTGFRASIVRISAARSGGGDVTPLSLGGWSVFGGNKCIRASETSSAVPAGSSSSDKAWDTEETNTSIGHRGVVDTITDATFRLNNEMRDGSTTVYIFWEAEGEL